MAAAYTIEDLQKWNDRIMDLVQDFGLDPYPQEFEICDHEQMLSYMVYSGMPSHYSHWSYGKAYEKLKTLYDYGLSGLPYEMVINSNPAIAYLMRDNTLRSRFSPWRMSTATTIFQKQLYFQNHPV